MGEIHSLAWLGELRPPKHLVNCTQYYVSTPTILSIKLLPNCNISFMMDQSTNKTTNEWLLQVAYGKTCPTLGALLFAWQQNHSVGCMKSKNQHTVGKSCLFWCSVFAMICPIKNPHNFHHFDDLVLNLHIFFLFCIFFFFLRQLLLVFCLFVLLPSSLIYFLAPAEENFLSKALVFHCFLVLWYRWIHFPKSVLSALSTSPVVIYSFLRKRTFSFIFMKSHR